MNKSHISVLGAGFSCIDIIKQETEGEKAMLGGTTANVLSILAQMGVQTSLLTAEYAGQSGAWLEAALEKRGIDRIHFAKTSMPAPRVVERVESENGRHDFMTKCPICSRRLNGIMLPNSRQVEKLGEGRIPEGNMFFYDRISEGIRKVMENNKRGWNFYEPNSARLYANLFRGASVSDIVKFSHDRISAEIAERLADDVQKYGVKLIIVSEGREGLKFKYRNREGKLSAWCKVSVNRIEDVRDSSGAGDWLTAVFSYRFLKKYPYLVETLDEVSLRRMFDEAQYIAALKCHFLGAQGIFADYKAISRLKELLSPDIAYIEDKRCEWQYTCSYCKI